MVALKAETIQRLHGLGWLYLPHREYTDKLSEEDIASFDSETLANALRSYAHMHELPSDSETVVSEKLLERSLGEIRYCSLPDRMRLGGQLCKWALAGNRVTWGLESKVPTLSREDQLAAHEAAAALWNAVCGIRLEYTANYRTANIVKSCQRIDGPNGTLAWSELPCDARQVQLQQAFDDRENWVVSDNPRGAVIDIVRTDAHETGHALGMDHIGSGNLLAPTYSALIGKPQPGDIAEMVRRYGQPQAQPLPTPTPTESARLFRIEAGSQIYEVRGSGRVTKIEAPGWVCMPRV